MLKRFFDFIFSGLALLILAPIIGLLAVLIRCMLGAPIFFSQNRPGINGKPFKMRKFRTMSNECSSDGILLPDERRLSSFGKWLRTTSLDELPELWNVLIGEMSLVGPRPLLMEYLDLYTPEQARRHDVRPGITGWAQVNGRNSIGWQEKFTLDIWYVDNQSFRLDIKILFLTILRVLRSEGISSKGRATMPKFTGNKEGA